MSVRPKQLDRVRADGNKPDQIKRRWRQRALRAFVQLAQDVRFALTARARAVTSQCLQRNETFPAILPLDGQFISNSLNCLWSHDCILPVLVIGVTPTSRACAALFAKGKFKLDKSNFVA